MIDNKSGTLILYDSENIKVPVKKSSRGGYSIPKVDMRVLTGKITDRFPDTHYSFIAFNKTYHSGKDPRIAASNRFKKTLEELGYTVIEKETATKTEVATIDGKKTIKEYEECDMDGEIIHFIHTLGKDFGRVILISGDSDMKPALDHIAEKYNTEVWVIAHEENMSNMYREEHNTMGLEELISYRGQSYDSSRKSH